MAKLIAFIRSLFAKEVIPPIAEPNVVVEAPQPSPEPVKRPPLLDAFCAAIRDYEGKPGDRNYKNKNPGNCRYSPVGYAPIYGQVLRDKDGFAIFKDYATGWLYLHNMIRLRAIAKPNQTIQQFMNVYAPKADSNDPQAYAKYIATRIGVDKDKFTMGELLS